MYIYKFKDMFFDVIDVTLDFLYPENISCILCNSAISTKNTYSMCKDCFSEMQFILDGCAKCGKPIVNYSLEEQSIENCSYCINKKFYFDRAISCIEYSNKSKDIVFKFKYNNKTYIGKYIAKIMKEKLLMENIDVDYILFVPLHKARLNKRGFNQAKKIAIYLSKLIDIPIVDNIKRVNNTKRLYKLNRNKRKDELKNAFLIDEDKCDLKGKNVLIVDDIFTTGSTVNEISKLLRMKLVNKIYIITLITGSYE